MRDTDPRPELFFGGFGEPLGNPDILAMVRLARQAAAAVPARDYGRDFT